MGLTNIKKDFHWDQNFWETNPTLRYYKPFSELYKRDKTKDKSTSSKEMWMIFFLCDPDDEANKFSRIPYDERLEMLKQEFYTDFDEEDDVLQDCLERYPFECLTAVERAFKEEKDSLVERAKFIKNAVYSFDEVQKDISGNPMYTKLGSPVIIKGTAKDLDAMRGNTGKIYKMYEDVENTFIKAKNEARVIGGRKESLSEQNVI